MTDARFFLRLPRRNVSSRLSRFPSGNLEPNVHTSVSYYNILYSTALERRATRTTYTFLSTEYVIFFGVFSRVFRILFLLLCSVMFIVCVCVCPCVSFPFSVLNVSTRTRIYACNTVCGQRKCNNGPVCLVNKHVHRNMLRSVRELSGGFFYRLSKRLHITNVLSYFTVD